MQPRRRARAARDSAGSRRALRHPDGDRAEGPGRQPAGAAARTASVLQLPVVVDDAHHHLAALVDAEWSFALMLKTPARRQFVRCSIASRSAARNAACPAGPSSAPRPRRPGISRPASQAWAPKVETRARAVLGLVALSCSRARLLAPGCSAGNCSATSTGPDGSRCLRRPCRRRAGSRCSRRRGSGRRCPCSRARSARAAAAPPACPTRRSDRVGVRGEDLQHLAGDPCRCGVVALVGDDLQPLRAWRDLARIALGSLRRSASAKPMKPTVLHAGVRHVRRAIAAPSCSVVLRRLEDPAPLGVHAAR